MDDQNNSQSNSDSVDTSSTDGNDFNVLFSPWSDEEGSGTESDNSSTDDPTPGCSTMDEPTLKTKRKRKGNDNILI